MVRSSFVIVGQGFRMGQKSLQWSRKVICSDRLGPPSSVLTHVLVSVPPEVSPRTLDVGPSFPPFLIYGVEREEGGRLEDSHDG